MLNQITTLGQGKQNKNVSWVISNRYSIIHHQYCCLLIADKMIVGIRTQSFFLVDRRRINCIGIERTIQNCSYKPLPRPHALLTSVHPLALVDCRGQ